MIKCFFPSKVGLFLMSMLMLSVCLCSNPAKPSDNPPTAKVLKMVVVTVTDVGLNTTYLVDTNWYDSTGKYVVSTFGPGSPNVRRYDDLFTSYPAPTQKYAHSGESHPDTAYSLYLPLGTGEPQDSQKVIVFMEKLISDTVSYIDSLITRTDFKIISILDTILGNDAYLLYMQKFIQPDSVKVDRQYPISSTIRKYYFKNGKIKGMIAYNADYVHTYDQTRYDLDAWGNVIKETVDTYDYSSSPATLKNTLIYNAQNTYW